jgi:glycerol-3-phosphate dehydrogenase (NAD(P)+)
MNEVGVIGAGAWGTALAIHAARTGRSVSLWARDPARAAEMVESRRNPRLPGHVLPPEIRVTAMMEPAELLLLAVPLQHLRDIAVHLPAGRLVVCAKGVETGTHLLPLEVLREVLPDRPAAVLTGPNFAGEIASGLPAASVVAASDEALREHVAQVLGTPDLRLYGNDDPVGAQVGGAAKNVIAIAAGAVMGAGLGENARAALVTRGLSELSALAVALGGRARTVAGLSGLGDLLLTCTGNASRNFSLGLALGRGEDLAAILAGRTAVTEGVATAPALAARAARVGVSLPVCEAVAEVVTGRMTVAGAMRVLQSRPRRDE